MAKKQNSKKNIFKVLSEDFKELGATYKEGDFKTYVTTVIFGFGAILRKQFLKGFAFLISECALLSFVIFFGWNYLKDITTLGTHTKGYNPDGTVSYGDNSFLILLYGLVTLFVIVGIIFLWRMNMREEYREVCAIKAGRELPSNKAVWASLFDEKIDKTLLALPVIGIFIFIVVPIIFMVCIAFTNYDMNHQSPAALFTWVGLENFKDLFSFDVTGYGKTFITILIWTLVWAFFATFLNYFLGMALAMLINKKGIKFKKVWRTIFVMTIAVPQFVSLLYMYKMFTKDGLINNVLLNLGWIKTALPFWTDPLWARVTIIVVNLWIGIPYLMLIATGLLMNIPADLYESATIDGANGWQSFWHITLPYMLFVTGPYLLTSYIGNLNNFNVIFLLTKGNPTSLGLQGTAGYTDLLVTWLYKMTVDDTNYRMAAVIGIMVFLVTATISLVVYGFLPSVKDEEGFQ